MVDAAPEVPRTVRSLVPARLDRLPWSPFHTRMVIALGVCWVLDGLEITVAGSIGATLQSRHTLNLSSSQVGFIATVYLWGEVTGALLFGRLSDRLGRRNLFMFTLGLYLAANALTALTWSGSAAGLTYFYSTRFVAGMGIGGEYSAINSAIDELIPASYRGRTDIAVNGTYWGGAIIGAAAEFYLLNQLPIGWGWRIGFLIGPCIGLVIWALRRTLPESPRWLLTHGRADEAERTIESIEREVRQQGYRLPPVDPSREIEIAPTDRVAYPQLLRVLLRDYRRRSLLGFSMMMTQSFLYNAIFFTYTIVLTHFYGVSASAAPKFIFFFAAGNLLGPLMLGKLFDTVGRRPMISSTYLASGVLLALTGWLFRAGQLTAVTQTMLWCVIFFIASAAASSAYLTVGEMFPVEMRAEAIAVFFAIAQLFGSLGPTLYGHLIGTGSRANVAAGYEVGAAMMLLGGLVAAFLGIPAERKSLEEVATPLTAVRSYVAKAASDGLPARAVVASGRAGSAEVLVRSRDDRSQPTRRGRSG